MSCPIDWAATGSMLGGVGAVGGAIAIVWAALVGKGALEDWRGEKLAGREVEAAEQALKAAYRAKDAIDGMRMRVIWAGELEGSEKALKDAGVNLDLLEEKEKSSQVRRGVVYRRADLFKDDFNAIFDAIPSAKIFFGDAVEENLRLFLKARQRILGSADMLPMMTEPFSEEDRKVVTDINRDLLGKWSDDQEDKVGEMVDDAVEKLEALLLPKLRLPTK